MKRIFAFMAVVCCAATMTFAQTEVQEQKYSVATNRFWSNWFVTGGVSGSVFYSNQEHDLGFSKSPFKSFRNALGFGVGVGKWFTPGIGTRIKFQGVSGKNVISESSSINRCGMKNYWTVNGQVLFNMSNLLCGYNENRIWNLSLYPGLGIMRNMSGNTYAMNLQLGMMNTFKITKHFDVFADVNIIFAEPKIDGTTAEKEHNRALFQNYDKIVTAEIGVKYNIGKSTWKKTPDVDAINAINAEQVAGLNASLQAAKDENARLKASLSKQANEIKELQDQLKAKSNVVVNNTPTQINTIETMVYFAQGKSAITSAQRASVERVANYLKQNPEAKVSIKGYCSPEGPAAFNQRLSEARANAVKTMLVNKYKIDASRIDAKGCGVGSIFSKGSWNRVAISTAQ